MLTTERHTDPIVIDTFYADDPESHTSALPRPKGASYNAPQCCSSLSTEDRAPRIVWASRAVAARQLSMYPVREMNRVSLRESCYHNL